MRVWIYSSTTSGGKMDFYCKQEKMKVWFCPEKKGESETNKQQTCKCSFILPTRSLLELEWIAIAWANAGRTVLIMAPMRKFLTYVLKEYQEHAQGLNHTGTIICKRKKNTHTHKHKQKNCLRAPSPHLLTLAHESTWKYIIVHKGTMVHLKDIFT